MTVNKEKVPPVKLALLCSESITLEQKTEIHSIQNEDTPRKETDRWKNRSKYKRNKKNLSTDEYEVDEQEVEYKRQKKLHKHLDSIREMHQQRQAREYKQKNDVILDRCIMKTLETQVVAADTAQVLDDQRYQLIQIDKELHVIDEDLNRAQKVLKGMTTWTGFIKRNVFKMKKDPPRKEYVAPIDTATAMERNLEL
eukprot:153717_1